MKHSWKTLSSKIVSRNPFFTVCQDSYQKSDGKTYQYTFLKMRPFVAIIPFASKDEIYLVKQLRYTIKRFSWEIPQGFVENKETALQAAKRELAEEAGFKAKRWENLGFTYLAVGHTNQKFFIFTAEGLTKIGKKLAGGEIDEVKKVSLTKVNEMLLRNQIETVTMASLFKFEKTITN